MATRLAEKLRKEFVEMSDEMYEPLTFGDLKEGENFIGLPVPGDNRGQGGFKGAHDIFKKIEKFSSVFPGTYNAIRLKGGISMMPDEMPVIKVDRL